MIDLNPTPPPLPDLAWRQLTAQDMSAIIALGQACHSVDGGLQFMVEAEEIKNRFLPDGPASTIGAFLTDGRLSACAAVRLVETADVQQVLLEGYVLPALRNQGLGTYLLHWSESQVSSIVGKTFRDTQLRVNTESLSEPANRLYRAHDYELVDEQLVMRRAHRTSLPDSTFPPDVTITDWNPNLADEFFQAYHDAFRERPGFPNWSVAEWVDHWTFDNEHFKPEWSILARANGTPIGFLMAAIDLPDCFVMQVGVVPSARRRGLASALITETMHRSKAAGALSTQLTVALNNPGAIQTYTSLGFETIGRRAKYDKPLKK